MIINDIIIYDIIKMIYKGYYINDIIFFPFETEFQFYLNEKADNKQTNKIY